MKFKTKILSLAALAAIVSISASCQTTTTTTTTTNGNANIVVNSNANISGNANLMNVNSNKEISNAINSSSSAIEAKEPEQYQASVSLKFQTSGEQKMSTPPIKAEVARNGADRRIEMTMPNGEKVIYLEKNGKQYLIDSTRKQFGELNKESVGFELRSLLMPEQIVSRLKNVQGVQRVGEEKVDGRDAIRYNYGATTNTGTKAGQVQTESYILVDKETGLPLRSETNSMAQNGSVQGVKGIALITELNNIRTTADANLFAEPTDYKQVEPQQIRQQLNTAMSVALALLGQFMKTTAPPPSATNTPNS